MKTYIFDIDGTICTQYDRDLGQTYLDAEPLVDRINKVNSLYDEGNTIIYFTARGMGRHKNNPIYAVQDFYTFTANQLSGWGAKYHNLILGKPDGDIFVDDKGVADEDFFAN
tara:strand:+ start:255 stop:590 length:336 start_codon:yes stop_codon:yes gene_type:complete